MPITHHVTGLLVHNPNPSDDELWIKVDAGAPQRVKATKDAHALAAKYLNAVAVRCTIVDNVMTNIEPA
jgi:hypothetical protein